MYEKDGICYADDPRPVPHVTEMVLLENHRFYVKFRTGEEKLIYLGDFFAIGTVFAPLLQDIEIEKNITIIAGAPTWLEEAVDVDPCYLFECGISADEERELLEKFRAEMDAAAECKRTGAPTYTSGEMLKMADEIMTAAEEQELSAKLEAELEKAEECKSAGSPTYTIVQVLERSEEILKEDGANENEEKR